MQDLTPSAAYTFSNDTDTPVDFEWGRRFSGALTSVIFSQIIAGTADTDPLSVLDNVVSLSFTSPLPPREVLTFASMTLTFTASLQNGGVSMSLHRIG